MKTGTCTKGEKLIHRTLCQRGIIVNYVIFTVLKNQPIKVIRIFNEMVSYFYIIFSTYLIT